MRGLLGGGIDILSNLSYVGIYGVDYSTALRRSGRCADIEDKTSTVKNGSGEIGTHPIAAMCTINYIKLAQ